MPSALSPSLIAAVAAVSSAVPGMVVTGAHRHVASVVPFSAGVLLGVMAFGVLPHIAGQAGWLAALLLFLAGYLLLYLVNRFIHPVCPSCSPTHDHSGCQRLLHGFAGPLVTAAALHSLIDGWTLGAAPSSPGLPTAITLHKLTEGVALGGLLAVAVRTRTAAFALVVLAEAPTVAGAALALFLAEQLGVLWTLYPLSIAAGSLLFLGSHAVHSDWKRRGAGAAFLPAAAGAAGAAVVQNYFFLRLAFG